MSEAPAVPAGWLRLQCRPTRAGSALVFPYELTNAGPLSVLVMDAWRSVPQDSPEPIADPQLAQVTLREDGVAVLGRYVPALPPGMRMVVPHLPLCVPLKPGEVMQREMRIPLPLSEQSPYVAEQLLSRYELVELKGLLFVIGWWPANQPRLAAGPCPYAPEFMQVGPLGRLPPAGSAHQRFPTTRLDILKRRDAFPRNIPVHPDLVAV